MFVGKKILSIRRNKMSQNEYKEGTKSPLMKQLYDGNFPGEEEAQQLRDELFYNHAIHAYLTMLPAVNSIGLRDGSEAAFGAGYNVLPIWKDRMDCRAWVPTPNADVIYSMSYLDLKETGQGDGATGCRSAARRHRHVH
jgi:hypothetical protein